MAISLVEEFLSTISASPMQLAGTGQLLGKASLSIGLAMLRDSDDEASWFQRADKLLYEAKRQGGNRVVAERDIR
jgi:diguanylate cyclase